jgi:AcrR family transcriptional regulator
VLILDELRAGRRKPKKGAAIRPPPASLRATRPTRPQKTAETRARLIEAALREFNKRGFFGTDTNEIARAAGYAPQTFYRHFADKTAIFLDAYERWWRDELAAVKQLSSRSALTPKAAAQIVMEFHSTWRIFRRSLRHLTAEDDRVRAARAQARHAQIKALDANLAGEKQIAEKLGQLLTIERLCDASADDEFKAFGVSDKRVFELVTAAIAQYLNTP